MRAEAGYKDGLIFGILARSHFLFPVFESRYESQKKSQLCTFGPSSPVGCILRLRTSILGRGAGRPYSVYPGS
jgi:hypothetical protein